MRPATRRHVEVLDVNQPQDAVPFRFLSQRQRRDLIRVRKSNRDRPVLPDNAIGLVLGSSNLRRRDLAARSMVEAVEPRWKLTVDALSNRSKAAESTC